MIALEVLRRESAVLKVFELPLRRRDDVRVEPRDLDSAGPAVDTLGDDLADLRHRVPGGAAGGAGVLVGLSGLEREAEALEAAKPGGLRRTRP